MRFILPILAVCLLASCSTWDNLTGKKTDTDDVVTAPSGLEGPAYDPSTSPAVMTQNTVLPRPESTGQPGAYGNDPSQPQTYSMPQENPADYPAANTPLSPDQISKGGAAPTTYSPETPAGIALAATLNGLWVNADDDQEIVEFTPDHYTTFYKGEMLFQEPMTYHPACPGDCNGGQAMEIPCFTVSGPAGTDCYGIIRLTPEVLEMSMLGVSTETIIYRKR